MKKLFIIAVLFCLGLSVTTQAQNNLPANYDSLFNKAVKDSGARYVLDSIGRVAGPNLTLFTTLKDNISPTKVVRIVGPDMVYTKCTRCGVIGEEWDTIFSLPLGVKSLLDSINVYDVHYLSVLQYLDAIYFRPADGDAVIYSTPIDWTRTSTSISTSSTAVDTTFSPSPAANTTTSNTSKPAVLKWTDHSIPMDAMKITQFISPGACSCDLTGLEVVDGIYFFSFMGTAYILTPVDGGYELGVP